MKEINGKYTSAKIFNDKIEDNDSTVWQIKGLINEHEAFAGSKVRIMPHLRSDLCFPIGLTATATDKVTPGIVDDDLGCGVTLAKVKVRDLGFEKVDDVIRKYVPSGSKLLKNPHRFADQIDFDCLYCIDHIDHEKAIRSIGTLGGRSHFIELDEDDSGNLYVAVLSGSRRLGREVSEYYIEAGWQAILKTGRGYPRGYSWVEGDLKESYLNDAAFVTEYATLNRAAILDTLCRNMKWKIQESYSCPHNYIDIGSTELIIRKGAVSAKAGEKIIIPVNMRDGIIVGTGKGNPDWNESAPHGSGRVLTRFEAKRKHTLTMFRRAMEGIYSSSIRKELLNESPFAYRGIEEIKEAITDTVTIEGILKPVYNFKAGDDEKERWW